MRSKRGAELSVNTLVIVIIAVLVLLVVSLIFSTAMRQIFVDIFNKIKSVLGLWEAAGIQ
jgi:cell division protein FtsN